MSAKELSLTMAIHMNQEHSPVNDASAAEHVRARAHSGIHEYVALTVNVMRHHVQVHCGIYAVDWLSWTEQDAHARTLVAPDASGRTQTHREGEIRPDAQ